MAMTPQQFGMQIAQQTKQANDRLAPYTAWGRGYNFGTSTSNQHHENALAGGALVGGLAGLAREALREKSEEEKKQSIMRKLLRYAANTGAGAVGGAGAGGLVGAMTSPGMLRMHDGLASKLPADIGSGKLEAQLLGVKKTAAAKEDGTKEAAFMGNSVKGLRGLLGKGVLGVTGLAGLGAGKPLAAVQKGLNTTGSALGEAAGEVGKRLHNFSQNHDNPLDVGAALSGKFRYFEDLGMLPYGAGKYPAGHFMSKERTPAKNIGERVLRMFETPGTREFDRVAK